jgi:hypothetical protein
MKKIQQKRIIILISITLIIFILTMAFIKIPTFIEKKINQQLDSLKTKHIHIEYQDLKINLWKRNLYFKDVSIKGKMQHKNAKHEFFLQADKFTIQKIKLFPLLLNNHINIHSLLLITPKIKIIKIDRLSQKSKQEKIKTTQQTNKQLNINTIHLDNGEISYFIPELIAPKIKARLSRISVKKLCRKPSDKNIDFEDFLFEINNFELHQNDSLNSLFIKSIDFSHKKQQMQLCSISYSPNFELYKYSEKVGYQTNRTEIDNKKVDIEGINIKNIMQQKRIKARLVTIHDFNVSVFKNKKLSFNKNLDKKFPNESLTALPIPIEIDSLLFTNGNLDFSILPQQSTTPVSINLDKIEGSIAHLNNDSLMVARNKSMKINARSRFMKSGEVWLKMNFPLGNPSALHYIEGCFSHFPLSRLNPLLQETAHINIKSGEIDRLCFTITADDKKATGTVNFHYHDLSLEISNNSLHAVSRTPRWVKILFPKQSSKNRFLSFMANSLLRSNNPDKNGFFQKGIIDYKHIDYKPVFNYWILSLVSGIKDALVTKTKEKKKWRKNNQ